MPVIDGFRDGKIQVSNFNPADPTTFKIRDVDKMLMEKAMPMIKDAIKQGRTIDWDKLKVYFGDLYMIPQTVADRVIDMAKEEIQI